MMLKTANPSDASEITNLHYSSEVAGILSRLTSSHLRENFYTPLLSDPKILSVSSIDPKGSIQGFIAYRAAANLSPFKLPKKNIKLFADVLRVILWNPTYFFILVNVLWVEKKTNRLLTNQNLQYGEIQILIVRKDSQGGGIGSNLITNLMDIELDPNIVVKTQSNEAKLFYIKHGFTQIIDSRLFGSKVFVLILRRGMKSGS